MKTLFREGRSVPADEVFDAWTSGDVHRMTLALLLKTNPIDRHFLLMSLFQQAYRRRKAEPAMRDLARRVGLQHVEEFSDLEAPLAREPGCLPRVPTFQNLATLLAEDGEYDMAIGVCMKAIAFRLSDGTKGGFNSRIGRLRKLAEGGTEPK